MKKLLFGTILLLVPFFTFAQVGKGLFVGGGLGFSTTNTKVTSGSLTFEGGKTTTFEISPRVGYFFTDNFGAGVNIGYASSVTPDEDEEDVKYIDNAFNFGVFGRYAIPLGDESKFAFIGDLNFGYSSITGKVEDGSTSTKIDPASVISINVLPGILFFPTPKIGIEAGLGNILGFNVATQRSLDNDDFKSVTTNFQLFNIKSIDLKFGLNYYFSR